MNNADIVIIGAGACGLMAASELSKAGKKVVVLEGRDRIGGRIHTIRNASFSLPVEAGAEFIHGDLPLTQSLLKEARSTFYRREGKMYRMEKGQIYETEDFIEGLDTLLVKFGELNNDMPFSEFLDRYLGHDKYRSLRESAIRFAEGYDAARIDKVSTVYLRDEWTGGATSIPYYAEEGYGNLIDFLYAECFSNGSLILLSSTVKEIQWQKGQVNITCDTGKTYSAAKCIITVPLAVLLSSPADKAHINFDPPLPAILAAARKIGYGAVIKVILEFNKTFWDDPLFKKAARQLPELGFLISGAKFPVWWTQLPRKEPILTGWAGGPAAEDLSRNQKEEILEQALVSLSELFQTSVELLREQLHASLVMNWRTDPFALGAYSYSTINSKAAISKITESVMETIYFAGEAFHHHEVGTVEAALTSGKQVAERIIMDL
jgi:monoamine oxidase